MASLGKKNAWTHESKVIPVPHGYIIQTQKMSSLPMTWLFFFSFFLYHSQYGKEGEVRITSVGIKSIRKKKKGPIATQSKCRNDFHVCVCRLLYMLVRECISIFGMFFMSNILKRVDRFFVSLGALFGLVNTGTLCWVSSFVFTL